MSAAPTEAPAIGAEATWTSPANLALIKYLGKHGEQLPQNPSISLSLREAGTRTTVRVAPGRGLCCDLSLDGRAAPAFEARVNRTLARWRPALPWLSDRHLRVETSNAMPHSAGLASSASAMSALALCLCELDPGADADEAALRRRASGLARLGSGSAARSLWGGFSLWGALPSVPGSSDLHGLPYPGPLHPIFADLQDAIAIVSEAPKAVSSSDGHAALGAHRLADWRYQSARARLDRLLAALAAGDWPAFAEIVEEEALEVHGLMLLAQPPIVWMRGATLELIAELRAFRAETGAALCFTLDAGPNLHLLYPRAAAPQVERFLAQALGARGLAVIRDGVGAGPRRGAA